jgi:hypothetical protein
MRTRRLPVNDQDAAEQIGRHRIRILATLLLVYALLQLEFASNLIDPDWQLSVFRPIAWMIYNVMILAMIVGRLPMVEKSRRRLAGLVNDELTRDFSDRAISAGFWMMLAVGITLWVYGLFNQLQLRTVAYAIVSTGVFAAGVRFTWLEWRAHKQ